MGTVLIAMLLLKLMKRGGSMMAQLDALRLREEFPVVDNIVYVDSEEELLYEELNCGY